MVWIFKQTHNPTYKSGHNLLHTFCAFRILHLEEHKNMLFFYSIWIIVFIWQIIQIWQSFKSLAPAVGEIFTVSQ